MKALRSTVYLFIIKQLTLTQLKTNQVGQITMYNLYQ